MAEEHKDKLGLCWRCEKRAKAFETGHGPRHECHADLMSAKYSCYCYEPVKPYVMERNAQEDDLRPTGTGYFAARSNVARVAKGKLKLRGLKDGTWVPYWTRLK